MKQILMSMLLIMTVACTPQAPPTAEIITTEVSPPSPPKAVPTSISLIEPEATSPRQIQNDDYFTKMGIELAAPVCNGLTQSQTEGPYYTPGTPRRNSLVEKDIQGTRLILVGYVLDRNCQPLPNTWMDFWQADANGVYDNSGYQLRGHQFTDLQGRFYLETIIPGEYPGRTEHIHVKIQSESGNMLTSQLYFPDVSANQQDGIFAPSLIVQLEDRGDYLLAYFNFIVKD